MDNLNTLRLAKKIRKIREIKGLSQENIALDLNISSSHYAKMKRGEAKIPLNILDKIAQIYGLQIEALLTFDEQNIFNQPNSQNAIGFYGNNIMNPIDKLQELYERLLKSKDDEIAFLKEQLKK
jgi:transcriptional regulator with XRE-family HTH domain